jgi:hypothetical protein
MVLLRLLRSHLNILSQGRSLFENETAICLSFFSGIFRKRLDFFAGSANHRIGLIFGHQLGGTIGQFIKDLEIIALTSELDEWMNAVEYIPF